MSADVAPRLRVLVIGASMDILGGHAVLISHLLDGFADDARIALDFQPVNPRLPWGIGWMRRVKYLRTVATSCWLFIRLLVSVRRSRVVHVFSASYASYLIGPLPALLVGKLFGRRTILNYHSGEAEDHLRRWPLSRLTMKLLADEVVVPSEYLAQVFRGYGIPATVILNFVPLERFRYRARARLAPVILSCRNLEPLYNVGCALRAFEIVQREVPEASLVVVGEGSERAGLERMVVTLGLRHVTFRGRVANADIPAVYDSCDIFLNASNIDCSPISIIEAVVSGLPIVSTRAGGIPYMVTDEVTGLLAACDDHAALAERILRLLRDPELVARLTGAARAGAVAAYAWPTIKAQWTAAYSGGD